MKISGYVENIFRMKMYEHEETRFCRIKEKHRQKKVGLPVAITIYNFHDTYY